MATVTLRSKTLRKEEGATDADEGGEDGWMQTHTTEKDRNESYYTEAIGASKLHDLLSSHHKGQWKRYPNACE